ncbi:MAG: GNAT family N-acetyltransferase [Polyangiales bacterium]
MTVVRPIPMKEALEFNSKHWPKHNARQGIDWKLVEYALGFYDEDECLGVAYYKVVGGMGHLDQIVVADGRTQQGIGSQLMKAFESHVAELGCHVVQLETAETQAPGFYERHGYERIGTYRNGRFHLDWHLYRKEIAQS